MSTRRNVACALTGDGCSPNSFLHIGETLPRTSQMKGVLPLEFLGQYTGSITKVTL